MSEADYGILSEQIPEPLREPLPEPLQLVPIADDNTAVLIQDIGKVKRNRGPGIKWIDIETENREEIIYDTFDDVLAQVDILNVSKLGEKSKKVFIYKCKFKHCPYRIKFMKRYDSKYDSSCTGAHVHIGETDDVNGNNANMRGLDDLQKKIVKEGFGLGIMSINQILKYFRIQRAKREATERFPIDPDRRKLTNYVASLKKKVVPEDPAEGEEPSAKKKRGPGRPKRIEGEVAPEQPANQSAADSWSTANTIRNGITQSARENDSDTEDEDIEGDEPRWPVDRQELEVPSNIVVVDASVSVSPPSSSSTLADVNKAPHSPFSLGKRKE